MTEDDIENAVADYRQQVKQYKDFVLEDLIEQYELSAGDDRQSQIDALVERFRQELKGDHSGA